jgi:hypothetical protein
MSDSFEDNREQSTGDTERFDSLVDIPLYRSIMKSKTISLRTQYERMVEHLAQQISKEEVREKMFEFSF